MTDYRARFPSALKSVGTARKAVVEFARQWFHGSALTDIESAVGEALANSAEHGHRAGTAIEVACSCNGERLTIEIKDYGSGFEGSAKGPERPHRDAPRGYGTYIMHELMDSVTFSERGTRVRMTKRLPAAALAAEPRREGTG